MGRGYDYERETEGIECEECSRASMIPSIIL